MTWITWIIETVIFSLAALVAAWREGRMTPGRVIRILGGSLAMVAGFIVSYPQVMFVGTAAFAVVRVHEAVARGSRWAALEAVVFGILAAAVWAARLRSGLDSPERVAAGVGLALAGYALIVWGMALGQTSPRAEPGAEEAEA